MGLFDFFAGGKQDLGALPELGRFAQDYLQRTMAAGGQPGAREMATEAAFRQAEQQRRSQVAGLGGQAGAVAQSRLFQAAPLLARQQAEATGAARAADVEAQRQAERQAFQQRVGLEQLMQQLQEQERQRLGATRRGAVSGLFDIGTKVATGGIS